jgi:hypothetical protein
MFNLIRRNRREIMLLEDLEEELINILGDDFSIREDDNGQLIIFTGLTEDEDGELVDFYTGEEDEMEIEPDLDTVMPELKEE